MSKITEKIKDTKDNGIYIECDLLGDGTEDAPYKPEVFNYKGYYHLDKKDIDYTNKKAKVWVNKKKTKANELQNIKKDSKNKIIKETEKGTTVEG